MVHFSVTFVCEIVHNQSGIYGQTNSIKGRKVALHVSIPIEEIGVKVRNIHRPCADLHVWCDHYQCCS